LIVRTLCAHTTFVIREGIMRILKWLGVVCLALVALGVLGSLFSNTPIVPTADVLVVRDVDHLRFTNDSAINLHGCVVRIDGYESVLRELPAKARAAVGRLTFNDPLPQAEFLKRSRTIAMQCYDDENHLVAVRVR
jgi:hypothetical protein